MKSSLPKYVEYKQSNFDYIGDIPKDWKVKRFKFCLSELMMYGANEAAESTDPDQPRFVRITDVDKNGNLREDTFKSLDKEIAEPYLLQEGDLLMARSGATVGKSFMYKDSWGIACFAGYLIRARLKTSTLIPDFGIYFLNSASYWGWVNSIFIQATIQNISAEKYANLSIPIPSHSEQILIARFLDQKTSQIDRLIEQKEELLKLLAEKRNAIITQAVTKGLDPDVKMKDSGIDWLGEIPKHWELKRLKFAIFLQRGHDLPADKMNSGEYPVCGSNGIIGYHDEYTSVGPSVTVGRSGSIGEVNYVDGDFWAHNTALYAKRLIDVHAKYAYYVLKTIDVKSVGGGSVVGTLNRNLVHNFSFPFPDSDEQLSIIRQLDQTLTKYDILLKKNSESIGRLKEYREALITAAVTGQIDVRKELE